MKVKLILYNGIKTEKYSKVLTTVYLDVDRFDVVEVPDEAIAEMYGKEAIDENGKYLVIDMYGKKYHYRNSYVDIFPACNRLHDEL